MNFKLIQQELIVADVVVKYQNNLSSNYSSIRWLRFKNEGWQMSGTE